MNKQTSKSRIDGITHTPTEDIIELPSPPPHPKVTLILVLLKKLSSAFSDLMESTGNRKAALSNQLNHLVLERQIERISRWPDNKTIKLLLHLYPLISRQLRREMAFVIDESVHRVDTTKTRIRKKLNPRTITERNPDLFKWLNQVF
jgi:hypothetical protein